MEADPLVANETNAGDGGIAETESHSPNVSMGADWNSDIYTGPRRMEEVSQKE
jgi:hypothetical protein